MIDRKQERMLCDFRVLAADLGAFELPTSEPFARALRFYAASRAARTPEERFLALYNGIGVLCGFPAARDEIERLLGNVQQALYAARADDDAQATVGHFPYDEEALDRLAAALRRHCCESIGKA